MSEIESYRMPAMDKEYDPNEEAADVTLHLYPCWSCEEEHPRSRLIYDFVWLYCESCYDRGVEGQSESKSPVPERDAMDILREQEKDAL